MPGNDKTEKLAKENTKENFIEFELLLPISYGKIKFR